MPNSEFLAPLLYGLLQDAILSAPYPRKWTLNDGIIARPLEGTERNGPVPLSNTQEKTEVVCGAPPHNDRRSANRNEDPVCTQLRRQRSS